MEESEQRIVALLACVAEAERALNDLGPLFAAEQQRVSVTHIDAALVVIGADPPISGDEVVLIEQVAQQCSP